MSGRVAAPASGLGGGGRNVRRGARRESARKREEDRDGPFFGGRDESIQINQKHKVTIKLRQLTRCLVADHKADLR